MGIKQRRLSVRAIVMLYRHFEQIARRSDISLAQYRLLIHLRKGPQRVGAIAAAAELGKPTISFALKVLREKGWLENATDRDGRVSVVTVTKAGEERIARFEHELAATMEAKLGSDDSTALVAVLAAACA